MRNFSLLGTLTIRHKQEVVYLQPLCKWKINLALKCIYLQNFQKNISKTMSCLRVDFLVFVQFISLSFFFVFKCDGWNSIFSAYVSIFVVSTATVINALVFFLLRGKIISRRTERRLLALFTGEIECSTVVKSTAACNANSDTDILFKLGVKNQSCCVNSLAWLECFSLGVTSSLKWRTLEIFSDFFPSLTKIRAIRRWAIPISFLSTNSYFVCCLWIKIRAICQRGKACQTDFSSVLC